MKKIIRLSILFVVLASNISCDQVSKNIVRRTVEYNQEISVIDNVFTVTKIENTGAFLSLGTSLPSALKLILLVLMPIVVLCLALLYVVVKKDQPLLSSIALIFIVGGGIGNVYDRIMYGSVTDFLHLDLKVFQTGIFNMADVSVMVGMGLLIWQMFFNSRTPSNIERTN